MCVFITPRRALALPAWETGERAIFLRPEKQTKNTSTDARYNIAVVLMATRLTITKAKTCFRHNNKYMTLNGGSLGSWIDEERSKVR